MTHSSTRKACKGVLRDTTLLTGVHVVGVCGPYCRIAEASESPGPSRGRILRLHVCATLPRARSTGARDYPAGVELAALCSIAEGREGPDAAHAGDGSAFGR